MNNKDDNRLKPALMAAFLVASVTVGISPTVSAECGDLDDRCTYPDQSDGAFGSGGTVDCATHDPGDPGSGQVDATLWYAGQNVFLACGFIDSVEDSILVHGGDVAWKMGVVATGGAELFDTDGLVPAAVVYQDTLEDAAVSQAQDTCAAFVGDENPTCGTDPEVSQTLQCPGGVEIPNPIGGGLLGDSLENSNGALQATCVLVDAGNDAAPNGTQVMDFSDEVQGILMDINGDVFAFTTDANDALCVYFTGEAPCV